MSAVETVHAVGAEHRARLLAGLPVAERHLDAAGSCTSAARTPTPCAIAWAPIGLHSSPAPHVIDTAADDPARDQPAAFLRALRDALAAV